MSGKEKEVVEIYIAEWIKPNGKTAITIFLLREGSGDFSKEARAMSDPYLEDVDARIDA